MAIYCVSYAEDNDWDESKDPFNTPPPADAKLEEAGKAGKFARLICWQDHRSTEVSRVNSDGILQSSQSAKKPATHETANEAIQSTDEMTSASRSSSGEMAKSTPSSDDRYTRLQIVKIVLEIIAIVVGLVGGIVAMIWKLT